MREYYPAENVSSYARTINRLIRVMQQAYANNMVQILDYGDLQDLLFNEFLVDVHRNEISRSDLLETRKHDLEHCDRILDAAFKARNWDVIDFVRSDPRWLLDSSADDWKDWIVEDD